MLDAQRDASNNIIIRKPRSTDSTSDSTVIIQGHLDMVCAKNSGLDFDFKTEGLRLKKNDEFIWAEGTTLGGDDAIAVAMALAVLESDTITHPALECVFTTDEEIGMLGAQAMDMSSLNGRCLLNIDSEDEGIFTVSCAGGASIHTTIPAPEAVNKALSELRYVKIKIGGLTGGHSGVEINKGRANANKIMGSLLSELEKQTKFYIADIKGGEKDNAIPRECEAGILIADTSPIAKLINIYEPLSRNKYANTDPHLFINYDFSQKWNGAICSNSIIKLINSAPNGVIKMSSDIEGLVQTSLNLGTINSDNGIVKAVFSVRSSVTEEKHNLIEKLTAIGKACGADITATGDYPAWPFRKNSQLQELCKRVYTEQCGKEPVISAIHAGLECGIFSSRLPGIDCISFGPDIHDIHTPQEKLDIKSTERVYNFLLGILKEL